jgi:hypothetical protein
MDLSKLSDADLQAISNGDMGSVSNEGLQYISGTPAAKQYEITPEFIKNSSVSQFRAENPIQASVGDFAGGMSELSHDTANRISSGLGDKLFPQDVVRDTGYKTAGSFADPLAVGITAAGLGAAAPIVKGITNPATRIAAQGALGGGASGATIGALSENGSAAMGGGTGIILGGVIPGMLNATNKYLYRPLMEILGLGKARTLGAGDMLNQAAGKDASVIQADLVNAKPVISMPNSAQATVGRNSPEFAALQDLVDSSNPKVSVVRDKAAEQARKDALRSIGRDNPLPDAPKTNLTAAENARGDSAKNIYGEAFAADQIRLDALKQQSKNSMGGYPGTPPPIPVDQRVSHLQSDKVVMDAVKQVARDYPQFGNPMESLAGLDKVRAVLKDSITSVSQGRQSSIDKVDMPMLINAKDKLTAAMSDLSPKYGQALKDYALRSEPINIMKVGQNLEDALNATVSGGNERPVVFANRIKAAAQIIKRTTGQDRFDSLSKLFTPDQMKQVQGVLSELETKRTNDKLAGDGVQSLTSKLGIQYKEAPLPNMIQREYTIANGMFSRLMKRNLSLRLDELSTIMNDPQLTAKIMKEATSREKASLKALELYVRNPTLVIGAGVEKK